MKRALWFAVAVGLSTLLACGSDSGAKSASDAGKSEPGAQDGGLDSGSDTPSRDGSVEPGADATAGDGDSQSDAGSASDGGASDDATTPGGDITYPAERGFELGGKWFKQKPNTTAGALIEGDGYHSNTGGLTAAMDAAGTLYIIFADTPADGTYTVVDSRDQAGPPTGTNVYFYINEARDMSSYWWSDGASGTVHVVHKGADTFDVVWENVSVVRTDASSVIPPGTKSTSMNGWYTIGLKP